MRKLTVGSCFSGIGGLELGLEWTGGFETKWQIEINPYASAVLAKHWPDVRRYGDITAVGGGQLERVDVICGGFPCQDVSMAGARKGLEGKRSTLWSELHRLVREIRPRWLLAENVPGLFSSDDGRFFGNILRDLAVSGYDAEWGVFSAAGVGAPHLRRRVFILAHPNDSTRGSEHGEQQSERPEIVGRSGPGDVAHAAGRESGIKAERQRRKDSIGGSQETLPDASINEGRIIDGDCENVADTDGLGRGSRRPERNPRPGRLEIGGSGLLRDTASEGSSDGPSEAMGERGENPESQRSNWWTVEPDVGGMASRLSAKLDGGGLSEQMDNSEKDATERRFVWEILRSMWRNQEFTTTPPQLRNRRVPDSLSQLPYKSGPTRWNPPNEENKELLDLWGRVSSMPFKEAQHLLPQMLERIGEAQRLEAMAPWIVEPNIQRVSKGVKNRVNRLKCLGNAVVPQVAQKVGEMILHHDSGTEGKFR